MAALFSGSIEEHRPISPGQLSDERESFTSSVTSEDFKEWAALKRSLRIVVTGKTGAGKSTLLNAFVGARTDPFHVGHGFDAGTLVVSQHTFTKHNVEVTVWDCPGLQDGTENEDAYLLDLKDKTKGDIDIMLYCIQMDDTRFDEERHRHAMEKLTEVLGRRVWKYTVIVLTFANVVVRRIRQKRLANQDEEFEVKVREWKEKICMLLRTTKCTSNPEKIEIIPAGFKNKSLPGRKYWLSSLWMAIFLTLKTEDAKEAVIHLNKDRFRTDPEEEYPTRDGIEDRPPPVTDDDFKKDIEEHPIVVSPDMEAYLHKIGAEIVAVSSMGAVVGATIGGVVTGVASFGVATPVGAGLGGVIGGGIGFIATSLFQAYRHRKLVSKKKESAAKKSELETSDPDITPEHSSDGQDEQTDSLHEQD